MQRHVRLRKLAAFFCLSGVLLGIQCPPLVIDAIKTGAVRWVSGSVGTINLTDVADALFGLTYPTQT